MILVVMITFSRKRGRIDQSRSTPKCDADTAIADDLAAGDSRCQLVLPILMRIKENRKDNEMENNNKNNYNDINVNPFGMNNLF